MTRKIQDNLFPTYMRSKIRFERGEGSYLYDEAGTAYLDCSSGVAVNALGHAHPRLVKVLKDQAEKLWHVSNLHPIEAQEKLAKLLCDNSFADIVFFANSGAEAVEACLKTARKYHAELGKPEKYRFITFKGAFHGRTLATIAAAGNPAYLEGFGPPLDGFDRADINDLEAVEQEITEETAGLLVEPVQGEGGIREVSPEQLRKLRKLCDAHNILLILDEVQSGMGRTGTFFAYQSSGVEPDILAAAKGLGGGFPIGACLAKEDVGRYMVPGTHGSTFGGNPLATTVAAEVTNIILEEGFLEEVQRKGLRFQQKLAQLHDENRDIIEEVRGKGLMIGLKLRIPVPEMVSALYGQHMLSVAAGENVLRLLPPLNITDEAIGEACDKLAAACENLRNNNKTDAPSGDNEETDTLKG